MTTQRIYALWSISQQIEEEVQSIHEEVATWPGQLNVENASSQYYADGSYGTQWTIQAIREIQGANNSRAEGARSNGGAGGKGESAESVGLVIAALLPEFQVKYPHSHLNRSLHLVGGIDGRGNRTVNFWSKIIVENFCAGGSSLGGSSGTAGARERLQLAEGVDGASKNTHPLRLKRGRTMQEKTQTTEVKAAKVRYTLPFTVWKRQLREYFVGGKGGQGGSSLQKGGGGGGLGEGPQISAAEAQRYREINGAEGGMGGVGQGPRFAKMLVIMDGKAAARVPHLTIAKFCQQFQLSKKIWRLLEERFETAGALLDVDDVTQRKAGFKGGRADCGGKEGAEGVCDQRAVSERAG
ncbi:hypothetical protein B0H14DRAFT_3561191 [Mycena olivaceomarginata]|nr:hypothetical protein B0H14DRAFT_3561191 [Mycena olivaceomarginata]